jgi:LEA14-like dessication related protein
MAGAHTVKLLNVFGFFLYCWFFSYPKINGVEKIEITNIYDDSIQARSSVVVNNSNFFSINVKSIHFKMLFNNSIIGSGKVDQEFSLTSNALTEVTADMNFFMEELEEFWETFISKDSVAINISSTGIYTFFNFSIDHEEIIHLSSSELIEVLIANSFRDNSIDFKNISVKKAGLSKWIWNFDFEVKNTLPVDVILHDLEVELYPDEESTIPLGKWHPNEKDMLLKENGAKTLQGDLAITFGGLLNTALSKMTNRTTKFYVKSKIIVKLNNTLFTIPYSNYISFNPFTSKIEIIE